MQKKKLRDRSSSDLVACERERKKKSFFGVFVGEAGVV
jgi:hypothetical protein